MKPKPTQVPISLEISPGNAGLLGLCEPSMGRVPVSLFLSPHIVDRSLLWQARGAGAARHVCVAYGKRHFFLFSLDAHDRILSVARMATTLVRADLPLVDVEDLDTQPVADLAIGQAERVLSELFLLHVNPGLDDPFFLGMYHEHRSCSTRFGSSASLRRLLLDIATGHVVDPATSSAIVFQAAFGENTIVAPHGIVRIDNVDAEGGALAMQALDRFRPYGMRYKCVPGASRLSELVKRELVETVRLHTPPSALEIAAARVRVADQMAVLHDRSTEGRP